MRYFYDKSTLEANDDIIVYRFGRPKYALSTSLYNGGYRWVDAVFNHRLSLFVETEQDLPGGSLVSYLAGVAGEYGLDTQACTGLITAAKMSSMAYEQCSYGDLTVEAVATAGVEGNSARAGEPARIVR